MTISDLRVKDDHYATMVPSERWMKMAGFETYLEIKPKNLTVGQSVEHEEK